MEFYGLMLIAGAGTFCAMLIAALIYVLMNHDGSDQLRWSEPNSVGSGLPQMIQETSIRALRKPKVDANYNPLAGLPEVDPQQKQTERRERMKRIVSDTQTASADAPVAEASRAMPVVAPPRPESANDKQRRTRLLQVIRNTQTKA